MKKLFNQLFRINRRKGEPEILPEKTVELFPPPDPEPIPDNEIAKPQPEEPASAPPDDGIDYSIYEDHFFDWQNPEFEDFQPEDARDYIKEAREEDEYIDGEDYRSLMDIINSEKDSHYLKVIDDKTPQQVLNWFHSNLENERHMSSYIWSVVGATVAPIQEAELLEKLDAVTPGRADGWVRARKKEGYFFTQKVYDKALAIRKGEIDNRKKKK